MYEHLIEFYNKKKHNIKRYHENSSEAIKIRLLTSFLDDSGLFSKIGYKQRIWHIINNQLSLKTCVICNKPVRWDDGNKRYSDTCCKECFLEYSKSDIIKEKIKQTNIQKYGAETYSQTEEGKLKQQQTCLEKYGVDNPAKAFDYNEKSKKTCLKKYGVDNSAKIVDYKEKTQQTCLKKYGVEHYAQTEECKEKSKKTCLEKYNVEYSSQSEIVKEKSRQTCLQKYGVDNSARMTDYKEKSQKTCLKKYGVKNISQLPEIKEKQKESYKKTCLERYGVISTSQLPEIKEKMRNTIKERFGVNNYSQTNEFREKSKKTCLKKYGVEYYQYTDEFKEKSENTCLQKYGTNCYTKSEEFKRNKEKHIEKTKRTLLKKYGTDNYYSSKEYEEKLIFSFIERLNADGYSTKGYKYVSYKGNRNHELFCPNCQQNFIINHDDHYYSRHKHNQEICTNCNPLHKPYSYGEKELVEYVSSIYDGTILENNRTVIKPKELDIYLPELHLAIEYNGDYWHANPKYYSEDHIIGDVPAKTVWKEDKQKINRCIKAGIELLVIWEDDWTNRQDVVKQELLDIITELTEKRVNN